MHKVAVYGSLKKGYGNHYLLTESKLLGKDYLSGWTMISLGSFPGIYRGPDEIHVEIYEVTDEELASLDRLEGTPTFYRRAPVVTAYGEAWIYYLSKSKYSQLGYSKVEGGLW